MASGVRPETPPLEYCPTAHVPEGDTSTSSSTLSSEPGEGEAERDHARPSQWMVRVSQWPPAPEVRTVDPTAHTSSGADASNDSRKLKTGLGFGAAIRCHASPSQWRVKSVTTNPSFTWA